MMKFIRILLIFFSLGFSFSALSQEDSTKVEKQLMLITKLDGRTYVGYVLEDDGREILLDTKEIGKIYIDKNLLKSIVLYDPELVVSTNTTSSNNNEKEEAEVYENLHTTKYIQSDNAFPLRRGDAFIKFMPLGLEAQIPLKKNWSFGAMTSYVGAPLILKTKISFPIGKKSYLSVDALYGSMIFGSLFGAGIDDGGGAISTGFTFGDRTKNFTVRAGYALIHESLETGSWDDFSQQWVIGPTLSFQYHMAFVGFSGIVNITPRADFIFEGFGAFGTGGTLITAAVAARFGPKPNHRFQTGFAIIAIDDFIFPLPIPTLSYTYIFDKRKSKDKF